MKKLLLFLICFFLVACVQKTFSNETIAKPAPSNAAIQQPPAPINATSVMSCTDSDDGNASIPGKVVLTYGNGQKESFKDTCVSTDLGSVFNFVTEYVCEGLKAKTKIIRCVGNCSKGACI